MKLDDVKTPRPSPAEKFLIERSRNFTKDRRLTVMMIGFAAPRMRDDMTFEEMPTDQIVTWITDVDEQRMWNDFLRLVDTYQSRHAIQKNGNRLPFGMA